MGLNEAFSHIHAKQEAWGESRIQKEVFRYFFSLKALQILWLCNFDNFKLQVNIYLKGHVLK